MKIKSGFNKRKKKTCAALLAGALAFVCAAPAFASPAFARTKEEWATLQDDNLNFEEIPDLITEYNATVKANDANYSSDELKNRSAQSTSDALVRMADRYDTMADAAEETTGGGVTAAGYRIQATQLRSQADENVSDYRVILLENDRMRLEITGQARELFLAYHEAVDAKDLSTKQVAYLERAYASAKNLEKYGMGTAIDTLTALESLQKAKADAVTKDAQINSAYKKLITMCGWKYDATPVIGPVPEKGSLAALSDEESDLKKVLEASITLKEDAIRLENAKDLYGADVAGKWEDQTAADTNTVKNSFNASRNAVSLSMDVYTNALAQEKLKKDVAEKTKKELTLGTASQMESVAADFAYESAKAASETAWKDVVKKYYAYMLLLEGLS